MTILEASRNAAHVLEKLEGNPAELLQTLQKQVQELRFITLDLDTTWKIGTLIREAGVEGKLPIAIDIAVGQQTVFHAALPGSSADNDAWARRKAAVTNRYLEPSLAVGIRFDLESEGFDHSSRLPVNDYAAHGGAFPLLLNTGIPVGHVVVSGLPAIHDHALVATAIHHVLAEQTEAPSN